MKDSSGAQALWHRLALAAVGGLSALSLWGLGERWADTDIHPTVYLVMLSFVAVQAWVTLALSGPIGVTRALVGALLLSVPVTALVSLAALRFELATEFLTEPIMLGMAWVLVILSTPFLSVWMQDRRRIMNYAALSETGWLIVVRYAVATCFVLVFWLVALLSNQLLELVHVTFLDVLFRTDWMVFLVSGTVLGLGLAVMYELQALVSAVVVLRLLRLLIPVVLFVVVTFLVAIPVQGFTDIFGNLSAAATLMAMAIASVILIATALDRTEVYETSHRGMRGATRGLALVLPVLAALAAWAVWLRVADYGWTPDRILAAMLVGLVLVLGVTYGAIAGNPGNWMARLRSANVGLALLGIFACALWLTPLLDPYRLSTANQIARFERGQSQITQLPLRLMAHDWGRAGVEGLKRLQDHAEQEGLADLVHRIEQARLSSGLHDYETSVTDTVVPDTYVEELLDLMPVRPVGQALPAGLFEEIEPYQLRRWLRGCRMQLTDGQPGCVFIHGDFLPAPNIRQQGIVLFLETESRLNGTYVFEKTDGTIQTRYLTNPMQVSDPLMTVGALAKILSGEYLIAPSGTQALIVDGLVLTPAN